jgi:hypothetical protein
MFSAWPFFNETPHKLPLAGLHLQENALELAAFSRCKGTLPLGRGGRRQAGTVQKR